MGQVKIKDFTTELDKFPPSSFVETQSVLEFMQSHPVKIESLAPFLTWDKEHYTRNLVKKTELYELMAICWEPGQVSSIHNHRDQNCWMAVPMGRLLVQNYHVIFQNIAEGQCSLQTTDITEMNPSKGGVVDPANPVHRVYNPAEFKQRAVSLHLYSRPFDTCVVYSAERGTCGIINLQYDTQ